MSDQPDLTVVLPAYLEEENLRLLLPRLTATLATLNTTWEVLVVDTIEPMDKTRDVCLANGCTYLARAPGNEFGDAVRCGIAASRGRRVAFMDADGSHPPEFLTDLWRHRDEADVVVASRYTAGGVTENSAALVVMSRILNTSYALVLGLPCKDVSNSFKIYPGDALRRLRLVCRHFDIVEEILYKLVRGPARSRVVEIPFAFKKRMFGDTKRNLLIFIASYVVTIVRLRCMRLDDDASPGVTAAAASRAPSAGSCDA
jgi:dolichol-phosphate mannosyltransferase